LFQTCKYNEIYTVSQKRHWCSTLYTYFDADQCKYNEIYTVSQKRHWCSTLYTYFDADQPILVIFG